MTKEMETPIQRDERKALIGDRLATINVIGALRMYREASRRLVRDFSMAGVCDSAFAEFVRDTSKAEGLQEDIRCAIHCCLVTVYDDSGQVYVRCPMCEADEG